jgi:hypothetical protein
LLLRLFASILSHPRADLKERISLAKKSVMPIRALLLPNIWLQNWSRYDEAIARIYQVNVEIHDFVTVHPADTSAIGGIDG